VFHSESCEEHESSSYICMQAPGIASGEVTEGDTEATAEPAH